jgi:hypothetical protein
MLIFLLPEHAFNVPPASKRFTIYRRGQARQERSAVLLYRSRAQNRARGDRDEIVILA